MSKWLDAPAEPWLMWLCGFVIGVPSGLVWLAFGIFGVAAFLVACFVLSLVISAALNLVAPPRRAGRA